MEDALGSSLLSSRVVSPVFAASQVCCRLALDGFSPRDSISESKRTNKQSRVGLGACVEAQRPLALAISVPHTNTCV